MVLSAQAMQAIAQLEVEIDRIETQTIGRLAAPPDNQVQQIELLGKLMLYDKQLSVNRNEACAFCHMPETGFTGPLSEVNRTTGSYPGWVRTQFSNRKPQSHAYAPCLPGRQSSRLRRKSATTFFAQRLSKNMSATRRLRRVPRAYQRGARWADPRL